MNDLVVKGGQVLTADGVASVDVGVADGVIAELGKDLEGRDTIAADGAWVGPGFVDLHTHVREPGEEWKEDIASASATAAAGGYTAIVAMPNTQPATDTGHLARHVKERGREVGLVDVVPSGALTLGRKGETMAHIDELWDAGVRLFTDDGDSVADASVLRLVMEYIAERGGVVSQHAVDPALSRAGYMHEGPVSSRLGMYGIPGEADDVVIARDLALAGLTGVRYHVQHLSTERGVTLIREAKQSGLAVTAEVTAHHLMFTDEDVATTDSNFKMMPPLRSAADRAALRAGLVDGTIDVLATDHAPHAALEKEVPFEHAPNGVLGLEWAASVFATTCEVTPDLFFDRMSIAPAAIVGAPDQGLPLAVGNPANIVVFDPQTQWIPTTTLSKSRNAPYFGRGLTGMVAATVFQGAITHGSAT
ncbi:MAG: dihydroorotase [Acidimicrobiia bacterium]